MLSRLLHPFYPDCSVCSEGYTASLGFVCTKCSDNITGDIALATVGAIVFLFVVVSFISYLLSAESEDDDRGILARVTRFVPLSSVKIVIVVWQIITQVSSREYIWPASMAATTIKGRVLL